MFVRPPARQSLSFHRANTLLRLPSIQAPSLPFSTSSSHRVLVARPEAVSRRQSNAQVTHTLHQERCLATAQGSMPLSSMYTSTPPPELRLFDLRPFDPSQVYHMSPIQDPYARARSSQHGIPGDVDIMVSVFNACIQVNKLERAALVLNRFGAQNLLPATDLVHFHNRYLRASIENFYAQPDEKWAESMQAWYETRIRGPGLPQTPETIACMLKISFLGTTQTKRLERLVDRYMSMIPGSFPQVLSYKDILSDQDLDRICTMCSLPEFKPQNWYSPVEGALDLQVGEETPKLSLNNDESQHHVRAVPQKGLGLKSLREVLSIFTPFGKDDVAKLPLTQRREIQSSLEKSCVDAALRRWKEEHEALMKMGRNTSLSQNALNSQLYEWQKALEARLKEEMVLCDAAEMEKTKTVEDIDRCVYGPFLKMSDPARLAAVTILSIMNTLAQQGVDNGAIISSAILNLSKAIEEDIKLIARKPTNRRRVFRPKQEFSGEPIGSPEVDVSSTVSMTAEERSWPPAVRSKLGAVLLTAILDTAKVNVVREHPHTKQSVSQVQPAFAHSIIFKKGKRVGMLLPNKFLVDLMKREPRADFLARHLPMLVEPEPWTKFDKGGFMDYPATLIRVKNGEKDQQIYAEAAIQRGDLEQVMKGLDVLGRTAWKINQPVLNVMLEAWNSGEEVANIPPLNPDIPVPPEPEVSDDPLQRRRWLAALKAAENEKSGLHSERCFMNFQLEIANAFRHQTLYFPHNMDFRGRAYPLPVYLNHMGADHTRGLLMFAEGRELGERGLRWLKVQLANVYGYDKASLEDREAFAMKNLDSIVDSVTNPFGGKKWWLEAEDPWQCLATCFEIKAALDLPDPTKYMSHLPIHQDGTCNGLQHYAALGGDLWGAQQVNLEPGERPADVYSAVAELVKTGIADDAKLDNPLAKAVEGKITRKVVKQTVMTNVYGVTFMGARKQVQKQLVAAYPQLHEDTGISPVMLAAYVASKIFKALSTMFRGAHDIQYWLGDCAGRVCRAVLPEQIERLANGTAAEPKKRKSSKTTMKTPKTAKTTRTKAADEEEISDQFRSTIVWTTPLRLPVVQPYRKSNTRVIHTCLQDLILTIPDRGDPVNRRKQLQAFPPNFIHSLDATHMLLSALECHHKGLAFAAVHDSFWTHAADVDVMNNILRDSFIRIHSEDVIKRLASEFDARYKGSLFLAKIVLEPELEAHIFQHRKTMKLSVKEELVREYQRRTLLESEDPAKVMMGRKMQTPTSIFEEYYASRSVDVANADADAVEEMGDYGLGNIPSPEVIMAAAAKEQAEEESKMVGGSALHNPQLAKSTMAMTAFEASLAPKQWATKGPKKTSLWLPLVFPAIPEKVSPEYNFRGLQQYEY